MGVNYNKSATPPVLGTWVQAQISTNYQMLQWDISSSVTNSGAIPLTFCWKTGANGLDVAWAALIENGVEIDRDTHAGFTGASPSKPLYLLRVPYRKPGATYLLRASVAGRGGTNSNGTIYNPNWD
jgi:hexosaminidase